MSALEVLSIDGDNMKTALGEGQLLRKIEEHGLEYEILTQARDYLWNSIDTGSLVSDAIYDATKTVFSRHSIEFDEEGNLDR